MPTERYNKMQQRWVFFVPDKNMVHESNIGWGDAELYFPAVSSCTALVMALDDNTLLGAHFDKMLSTSDVDRILDRMLEKKANRSAGDLAVIGNLTYGEDNPTRFMSAPEYKGERQVVTFAKKFGIRGFMYQYDQGQKADKHYRVKAIGERRIQAYYAAVIRNDKDNPLPLLDPNSVTWLDQPLTLLR
jgi:hypothetical protein